MYTRLNRQKNSVIFSNVQYRPLTTIANISAVTPMNVTSGGMLNKLSACVMPMYSVTSVSQLISARSKIENHPQNGPKPSKIASACPRFVTAPSRTVISCT